MKGKDITTRYTKDKSIISLDNMTRDERIHSIFAYGLAGSSLAVVIAALFERHRKNILLIQNDQEEAGYLYNDLCQLTEEGTALFFPSSFRRAAKYGQRDTANEILRTETTTALSTNMPHLIVTSPEGLSELVVSQSRILSCQMSLSCGQEISMTDIERNLLDNNFQRVDYVYEPGQFAVRGSILDIFSFSAEQPYRVDFFGDEIDSIRTFEVESQLSTERRQNIVIVPRMSDSVEDKKPLTSFFADGTLVVAKDMTFVTDSIGKIYEEGFSRQALTDIMAGATEVERKHIEQCMRRESQFVRKSVILSEMSRMRHMEYGQQRPSVDEGYDAFAAFSFSSQPLYHKNFKILVDSFRQYIDCGYTVHILSDSSKQIERLQDIVSAEEYNADDTSGISLTPVSSTLHEGFVDNGEKACFFTDHQIFDRYHKYTLKSDKARQGKMALTMKELQEMEPGDYIVHMDYGIGKFAGLVRIPVGNSYQEVIRIVYQNNDKVDVSIHSLYKISKYRSSTTGEPPRLSHLGTGAWERLKERTKKKIKDIARDLIRLYAKRRHEKGYSFSPDSYLQNELEASFIYEDTPDQLRATQEVKRDMESSRPMDRLVCGDVGFGKTEVAIRAAFKAVCDSKQVAVLVPTTVLAFQHYKSFTRRMEHLPVRVDYLSRARTAKQTAAVLADLNDGKIDILIGTHKIIGKNVRWHDIGLLIIDEEQKFGVSTKEKIKQLKTNIDTLTMSATPIPRTLQFSLMGARDMSIMRTPPPNRHPIQTELGTYGTDIIREAIEFEMSRDGQVFFVSPRISNLHEIRDLILRSIPDCRIAVGHGQMSPAELEKIVVGFMNYDYDVLLSTTIVENGIDIPNANTIIINDAHRFGLSDLHQMRGRVGRGNRKAFCYLLSPPLQLLPADTRRRLEALETFSDLGSGFSIAMQDLDLRGAGNLLGAEQSGFMEDLGYETYQKILRQAVTELRNEEFQALQQEQIDEEEALAASQSSLHGDAASAVIFVDDCAVESDLEMYFPDLYVPGAAERMLLYRELDRIETDEDLASYRQRLVDRFGPVPNEGEELMSVVMLRRYGRRLGCEKIVLKQGRMQLHLLADQNSPYYRTKAFASLISYATENPHRCQFKSVNDSPRIVISSVGTVGEALAILKGILPH